MTIYEQHGYNNRLDYPKWGILLTLVTGLGFWGLLAYLILY